MVIQIHFQFLKVQSYLNQIFSLMCHYDYQVMSNITFWVERCDLFCYLFYVILNQISPASGPSCWRKRLDKEGRMILRV